MTESRAPILHRSTRAARERPSRVTVAISAPTRGPRRPTPPVARRGLPPSFHVEHHPPPDPPRAPATTARIDAWPLDPARTAPHRPRLCLHSATTQVAPAPRGCPGPSPLRTRTSEVALVTACCPHCRAPGWPTWGRSSSAWASSIAVLSAASTTSQAPSAELKPPARIFSEPKGERTLDQGPLRPCSVLPTTRSRSHRSSGPNSGAWRNLAHKPSGRRLH